MIELKQKVYHRVHGWGIVENTYNNGATCLVDFRGKAKVCETGLLRFNDYQPKNIGADDLRQLLNELQEEAKGETERAQGAKYVINKVKGLL